MYCTYLNFIFGQMENLPIKLAEINIFLNRYYRAKPDVIVDKQYKQINYIAM